MNKFDEQKVLRTEAFLDTLKLLEKEDIKKKLENSRTKLYREDKEIEIEKQNRRGEILVLKTSTLNASKNFKDKVCILNFASATNPGGGVKNGSNAQEESICRVTSLYKELSTQFLFDNFYMYHRERKNTLYTNRIIYSENVLVLKEDFAPYNAFSEDSQRFINVITSPAPNIRNLQGIKEEELLDILTSRIIRILEIYHQTGKTKTQQEIESRKKEVKYDYKVFVLNIERELLYERINKRVDIMIEQGLLKEVEDLITKYPKLSTAKQAIGYKEIIDYLQNKITFEEAIEKIKQESRRYAKRQITWFKRIEDSIWLNGLDSAQNNINIILEESNWDK